jgi:hypothetical protein
VSTFDAVGRAPAIAWISAIASCGPLARTRCAFVSLHPQTRASTSSPRKSAGHTPRCGLEGWRRIPLRHGCRPSPIGHRVGLILGRDCCDWRKAVPGRDLLFAGGRSHQIPDKRRPLFEGIAPVFVGPLSPSVVIRRHGGRRSQEVPRGVGPLHSHLGTEGAGTLPF